MGSVTGSGVGGNIGGPQGQLPLQQELSATDQIPRILLGITRNTDDLLFTTFGKMPYGPDKRDYYRSDPSNPNLERPLNIFRMATGLLDDLGVDWQGNYQQVLNMLPDDQRENLRRDQQLPPEQQNPYLQAMDEMLQATAVIMTYFEFATAGISSEMAQIGAIRNAALPLAAAVQSAVVSGLIAAGSYTVLESVGRNDPNYDNISLVTRTINGFATQYNSLVGQINEQGLTPELQAQLTALSNRASDFLPQASVLLNNGEMGALLTTLSLMSTLAGAAGLGDVSSALLIGASSVLIGLGDTPIGTLAAGVASGLLALAFPNADAATGHLLQGIAAIGLIVAAAIAYYFGTEDNPTAVEAFKQELGLILLNATGALPTLYGDFAAAMGADENGQAIISAGLTTLALLMIAYVWTPSTSSEMVRIPDGILTTLANNLSTLADAIDEGISHGSLDARASAFAASLQQAAIALQQGDRNTFLSTLQHGLETLGISWTDLENDLSNVQSITNTSTTAIDPNNTMPPTTTIAG